MSELLPCPFCGGCAYVREDYGMFCATCLGVDCFCAVGEGYDRDAIPSHSFFERETAIAAWNTRAKAQPGDALPVCGSDSLSTSSLHQYVSKKAGT